MNYKTYTVRVYESGTKFWLNEKGQWHNEHGPAVEWANGSKSYYLNHKLHRTDGPAVEMADGSKLYYLNGEEYSYEAWKKEVEKMNQPEVKELTVSEVSKLLDYDVKIVKE